MRMPPEEQARRQRLAKKNHDAKRCVARKKQRLARKRTATARALVPDISIAEVLDAGLTVTRRAHATLWWLDKHGRLHREDRRSAEQVILDERKTP